MENNINKTGRTEKNQKKNTVDEVLNIFNKGWNKQVILYGPPGTSKTYSVTEIAARFLASKEIGSEGNANQIDKMKEAILEGECTDLTDHEICEKYLEKKEEQYKVIQFHPSYSYEDFVRGIVVKTRDEDDKSLSIPLYEVERKIIETFGEGATKDKPKVLVIDEINRAPLGSVLGELIYGLEYRGKAVSTPYVYKKDNVEEPLKVSEYLYIIGTMNTADRSIGTMDYAVRRRFAFVPVYPCADVIENTWNDESVGSIAKKLFEDFMNKEKGIFAEEYLEDAELDVNDIKIGHTYFLGNKKEYKSKDEESDYLKYRINYQIKPVYQEYVKDGLIKKTGLEQFETLVKKAFENYENTGENSNQSDS